MAHGNTNGAYLDPRPSKCAALLHRRLNPPVKGDPPSGRAPTTLERQQG